MTRSRTLLTAASALGLGAVLVGAQAPAYQVDPLWPKPLPNHWILGSVTGVAVDSRDHVWIVHRGQASLNSRTEAALNATPPGAEGCCAAAPPVLEFDASGTLVGSWGGPGTGFDWPQTPGGLAVDRDGNIWIAAAGNDPAPAGRGGRGRGGAAAEPPPQDAQVLRFSRGGQFQLQIGKAGQVGDAASTSALNRPADVAVDATDAFVADSMNQRIVVFDAKTGAHKRHWSAAGANCVAASNDGHVYVCDRASNTLRVYRKDGTAVRDVTISGAPKGPGAVWDVAFSSDPAQQFLFVANSQEQVVTMLNRSSLDVAGRVGSGGGRWPGYLSGVAGVAVDSQGNVYTAEAFEGKRVQKFVRRAR